MGRAKYIYCGIRSDAINQKISVTSNVLRAVFCVLFVKVLTTLGLVHATRTVFLRRNCLPWRSCLQPSINFLNHGSRFHAFVNYTSLSALESCPKRLYSAVGAVATEGGRGGDLVAKNVVLSAKPKNEAGAKAAPIHLSAQELGIIKVVNCSIILDVHTSFPKVYGDAAKYSQYTKSAVERLFAELDVSDSGILAKAYRAKWPAAEAVSVCRGYQALMLHMYKNKEYERLLRVFVDLLDHPFLLRTYMFNLSSISAYLTYVDGWVLPLLFLHVYNLYGPQCLMKVPTFTSFNTEAGLPILPKSEMPNKRQLYVEFNCARNNKLRINDVSLFHSNVMEACLHAREFKSAIAIYFNNLSCSDDMENIPTQKPPCNFSIRNMDPSALVTEHVGGTIHDIVREVLAKTAQIESELQLKEPTPATVEKDLAKIIALKVGKVSQCEELWWRTLMLKHALHNVFLSVDVPTAGNPADTSDEHDNTRVDVSRVLAPYSDLQHLGNLPIRYYQALLEKPMFRRVKPKASHTVEEFMGLFDDGNTEANTEVSAKTIMNFIHKPLGGTFLKDASPITTTEKPTLNSLIEKLKEAKMRLSDLGTMGIFSVMRRLLSFGISGTAAVKLFALIFHEVRFQAWAHYGIFLSAFEADMERRDVVSLDRLLDCMLHWDCTPEPAMYARFFDLCASHSREDLIMKHSRIYVNHIRGVSINQGKRFGMKRFSRVSFDMYCHMLSVYKRLGRYREGLLAFKQLLLDVNGLYRIIPLTIWRMIRAMVDECSAPHDLKVLVEQCEKLCKDVDVARVLERHVKNAEIYSRPVIARELESLIDNFVKSS